MRPRYTRITEVRDHPWLSCLSVDAISGRDSRGFFVILLKAHEHSSTGLKGPAAEKGMLVLLLKLPGFPHQDVRRDSHGSAAQCAQPQSLISAGGLLHREASRAGA